MLLEARSIEQHSTLSASLHRRGLDHNKKAYVMSNQNRSGSVVRNFDGLRVDACDSWTLVIGVGQYQAHYDMFKLLYTTTSSEQRIIGGVGGKMELMEQVTIQISFMYLDVIINSFLLVIRDDISTLLWMNDMVGNGLDISIKGGYVSLRERRHPLAMDNYFLIHW